MEKDFPFNPIPIPWEIVLNTPPPQSSALWGRIKEGAKRVDLTGKRDEGFIALPTIPSHFVGGEIVGTASHFVRGRS